MAGSWLGRIIVHDKMAKVQIEASWLEKLQPEFDKPYFEACKQYSSGIAAVA